MGHSLARLRFRAFSAQNARCYYCNLPMWLGSGASAFSASFGMLGRCGQQFRCTAEHLHARGEGGKDRIGNVVAACSHCNLTRHRRKRPPSPERWRVIQRRRASRRWLQATLSPFAHELRAVVYEQRLEG
jgi:HNH endonuclease